MRAPVVLLCAVLLAGCASDEPPAPTQETVAPGAAPEINETFSPLPPPPWESVLVDWTGHLGERLIVCEWDVADDCTDHEQTAGETDYILERPGAWLRGATINLTWEPEGRVTEELGLGLMVMGTCPECQSDMIEEVQGRSPLTISTPYLDLALDENRIVHAYVWNASGSRAVGSAYIYGTSDQAFTLRGVLALEESA